MKFYNKYYESNYEELTTYYPRYYLDVFEMTEILKAEGKLADDLEDNIELVCFNNFVATADLQTVETWENLLGITNTGDISLEQRKSNIIARISGYGHIGEPEIRSIVSNYTDQDVSVSFADGTITVVINDEIFDEQTLLETLRRRIPAHLQLKLLVRNGKTIRTSNTFSCGAYIYSQRTSSIADE